MQNLSLLLALKIEVVKNTPFTQEEDRIHSDPSPWLSGPLKADPTADPAAAL